MPRFKSRLSLSDRTYGKLKAGVFSGDFREGEYLPTEDRLCRIYGVSRKTIRTALKKLAMDGLINPNHGHGWKLSPESHRKPVALVASVPLDTHREFIETLMSSLSSRGYGLLIHHLPLIPGKEGRLSDHMLLDQIGGVIHFSGLAMSKEDLRSLGRLNIPAVGVSLSAVAPYDSIAVDSVSGTKMLMEHLLSTGHRKILFLNCLIPDPSFRKRLDAYRAFVSERSIPSIVMDLPANWVSPSEAVKMNKLIKTHGIDAIVAVTDAIAKHAMLTQGMKGVEIPGDVSIAAYGDFVPKTEFIHFGVRDLSGVKYPFAEMARKAADTIVRRMEGDSSAPHLTLLPPSYTNGDSVRERRVLPERRKAV